MKIRFAAAYVLCVLFGFAAVVAFAGQLKQGTRRPARVHADTQVCDSPTCAQLGDSITVVLSGRVTQVQQPQPGVVCIQVQAAAQAGDKCVPS